MSLTGAAIETNHYLRVGETVVFQAPHKDGDIHMQAKVVWCRLVSTRNTPRGDSEPVYSAGVSFSDVLTAKAKALFDLLRNSDKVTVETRVTGRFRLELADPVKLDREHEFSAKQVSISGMLIETNLSPELDSVFEMRINLGTPITVQGRIVHIQDLAQSGAPTRYRLGVEFVNLPSESRDALESYIGGLDRSTEEPTHI